MNSSDQVRSFKTNQLGFVFTFENDAYDVKLFDTPFVAKGFPLFEVHMKLFSGIVILVALLGLLVYTNPDLDQYNQFISQRITEVTRKGKDPVAGALGSLLGGVAANLMTKQTVRKDYVFFSTYDLALGNDHIRAIGVLNNFYITEKPESMRTD